MSWLTRKSNLLAALTEDIVIIRKELSELSIELDGLKLRFKKKIILPPESKIEKSLSPDGLDEARNLL